MKKYEFRKNEVLFFLKNYGLTSASTLISELKIPRSTLNRLILNLLATKDIIFIKSKLMHPKLKPIKFFNFNYNKKQKNEYSDNASKASN